MNSNKKLKTRKAACRFSPQEDMIIKYFVAENGPRQWNRIESFLPFRTARQCRDRYNNYLRPGLTIENWTDEEEKLLQQKVKEFGKKWTIIAKFFHGRSTNCLKNHWNYRKVKRDDYSDTNTITNNTLSTKASENASHRETYVGSVYNLGADVSKEKALSEIPEEWSKLHRDGHIHIHDLDAYDYAYNCITFRMDSFPYEEFASCSEPSKIPRMSL